MATTQTAPAASRRWLTYGAVVLLLVIASGLIYRQFAGTTIREQRIEREKEKAAQELAAKAPADANGFSAKLLEQFRRGQTELQSQPATPSVAAPPTPGGNNGNDAARPAPGAMPGASAGSPQPTQRGGAASQDSDLVPLPSQEDDTQYEERRARLQLGQSRRIGVWEAGAGAQGLGGVQQPASPIDSLIAAAKTQAGQTGQAGQGTAQSEALPAGTSALEELAKRFAGGANALPGAAIGSGGGVAKDEQFTAAAGQRQATKSQAEPLRARRGYGRYSLLQGSAIRAVMVFSVSSDLAGECRARVDRPVYDTVTQQDVVVPAGSTLICTYSTDVTQGQEVLLIAFTRLIFPSGASVDLGGMAGADMQGRIGVPATVNSRFWRIFGSSFLIAAVAKVAENKNSNATVAVNLPGTQAGGVAANVLADVARKSLERNTNLRDELRVRPGDVLTVIVSQDMVLDPAITRASLN